MKKTQVARISEKEFNNLKNKIKIKKNISSDVAVSVLSKDTVLSKDNVLSKNDISSKDKYVRQKKKYGDSIASIVNNNLSSKYEISFSKDHFGIVFNGAKLLTTNRIFSSLQTIKSRHAFFKYKKSWHSIIGNIFFEEVNKLKGGTEDYPFFKDPVKITLLRQSKRLVDEDAMPAMFKFIIDAFKNSPENPNGILMDDNKTIMQKIEISNLIGEDLVGIRIEKIKVSGKKITACDILKG